ncbi:spore germination protein PB [Scopulibacillus daqui]|uniref:Spore germination protein PB n=1 Tax=Scopulibacillus daqui TaxID=1469162 RepID=A0ABS2PYX8_9BACL|nr:spore germination protein GerPB [Scopulibacillus daqui]MBM7645249.1 spore germination protein PB [Scopulibacillus daqui]
MNFFINQEIHIHQIRINGLSNSSVLQIGSAGMIKPISNAYNSGRFTQPAPQLALPGQITHGETYQPSQVPAAHPILVPLPAPR